MHDCVTIQCNGSTAHTSALISTICGKVSKTAFCALAVTAMTNLTKAAKSRAVGCSALQSIALHEAAESDADVATDAAADAAARGLRCRLHEPNEGRPLMLADNEAVLREDAADWRLNGNTPRAGSDARPSTFTCLRPKHPEADIAEYYPTRSETLTHLRDAEVWH